jgi:hypothetical protein
VLSWIEWAIDEGMREVEWMQELGIPLQRLEDDLSTDAISRSYGALRAIGKVRVLTRTNVGHSV